MSSLPIEPILGALGAALRSGGRAVLQAPPGAGKTTRVPLHLLEQELVTGRILMLEPRRVAARAAAERLAASLGEAPGGRVGYRTRGESVPGDRIEVVTEGVLTRMLQSEPDLPGVGCVIFDEFHERALQADLGLALTLEACAALRPDLAIIVMSATLDAAPVAALIGAPVLTAEGRAFPVETRWLDRSPSSAGQRFEAAVADLTLRALDETEGGLLVFLPGQAEIARASTLLAPRLPAGVRLQPLHGGLPFARQREALAPLADGRKLVLATAIAETSLTIPDVRVVIDGGRARRPRHDPGSGMTRLVTTRVSRAEAEQRRGRAGRVAPGWCYRFWTRGEEGAFEAFAPPEITVADLTGLALELALWGTGADSLAFLTPPPPAALTEARALLADLGALDHEGRITGHGRALARLPLHPRLGHMTIEGARLGAGPRACELAALMEARDPLRGEGGPAPADLALRLAALRDPGRVEAAHPVRIDRPAIEALRGEVRRLRATLPRGSGESPRPEVSPGGLLSLAYPDRVAQRRPGPAPRYLVSGGKGAALPEADPLAGMAMLVAADLDGDPREARVRRALPIAEAEIRALHAGRLAHEEVCAWSRRDRAVITRRRLRLGALVLEDRPWPDAPPERVAAALAEGVRQLGIEALPWTPAARGLAARAEWLRARGAALPDFSAPGLLTELDQWLAPWLGGMSRAGDLAALDLGAALGGRLDRAARALLDRLAPAEIFAPTGTRLPIDYSGAAPSVSARLQEMFGLTRHPTIGPDAVPLVIELLSPGRRPVQTTSDLPGFWTRSYAEVRRDLRGRYPRHPWPEDPATAEPTRRAKPRGA